MKEVLSLIIMLLCVVPSYTSYTSRKIKAKDVKGWHRLSTDRTIRNKWIAAVRREPEDPEYPDDFRVCGLHFEDECFVRDLKAELTGAPRTFMLKVDAVPSVFAFSEQKKK